MVELGVFMHTALGRDTSSNLSKHCDFLFSSFLFASDSATFLFNSETNSVKFSLVHLRLAERVMRICSLKLPDTKQLYTVSCGFYNYFPIHKISDHRKCALSNITLWMSNQMYWSSKNIWHDKLCQVWLGMYCIFHTVYVILYNFL